MHGSLFWSDSRSRCSLMDLPSQANILRNLQRRCCKYEGNYQWKPSFHVDQHVVVRHCLFWTDIYLKSTLNLCIETRRLFWFSMLVDASWPLTWPEAWINLWVSALLGNVDLDTNRHRRVLEVASFNSSALFQHLNRLVEWKRMAVEFGKTIWFHFVLLSTLSRVGSQRHIGCHTDAIARVPNASLLSTPFLHPLSQ